jgi:hypothetical protein
MKFNLKLTKNILSEIENDSDGISEHKIDITESSASDEKEKAYHLRILIHHGIVDGRVHDVSTRDGRAEWIYYKGLTMQGHQILDVMRNDTLWNKLKNGVQEAGIEALKKIPALALELLMKGLPL